MQINTVKEGIMKHVIVYRNKERYAGWPANYGIWNWGDEIVTGFTLTYHDNQGGFHYRDKDKTTETIQSRSLDGGMTWTNSPAPLIAPGNIGLASDEHMNLDLGPVANRVNAPKPFNGSIDTTAPDFALLCSRNALKAGASSWFYISKDRCHHWDGPYTLPMFNQLGIAARTDYLTYGPQNPNKLTLLLSSTKPDGDQGRVFCAQSTDGGQNFIFKSWLRENPDGLDIMPSSVKLDSGSIITAVRCRNTIQNHCWIDLIRSDDDGANWHYVSTAVSETGIAGNPPAMLKLPDNRIALMYGYRSYNSFNSYFNDPQSGIHCVISEDEGETWNKKVTLREDAGNQDIGYPRAIVRKDGQIVVVYYYNDSTEGERYIAATIWKP